MESGGDLFGHGEARRLVEHLSLCRVMRERAKACRWLGWVALGRQESEDWCERSRYLFFRGAHVLSLVLGEGESREKLSARLSMVAFEKISCIPLPLLHVIRVLTRAAHPGLSA